MYKISNLKILNKLLGVNMLIIFLSSCQSMSAIGGSANTSSSADIEKQYKGGIASSMIDSIGKAFSGINTKSTIEDYIGYEDKQTYKLGVASPHKRTSKILSFSGWIMDHGKNPPMQLPINRYEILEQDIIDIGVHVPSYQGYTLILPENIPEDKKNIQNLQSFSDRIEYIDIPYVLDLNTEVEIYRNIFGRHIDEHFVPRVLHNFARVIISSRLKTRSEAMLEWIEDPKKYQLYCDENLQLLN